MKNRIGIYYASISGKTTRVAHLIADALNIDKACVHNLIDVSMNDTIHNYDLIILGSPTYGKGDLHYLWQEEFLEVHDELLMEKPYAIFALGDKKYHRKTYGGALEKLNDSLEMYQGENFGFMLGKETTDIKLINSYGLILDEVNEPFLTNAKISSWCSTLKKNIRQMGYLLPCESLRTNYQNFICKQKCKTCTANSH